MVARNYRVTRRADGPVNHIMFNHGGGLVVPSTAEGWSVVVGAQTAHAIEADEGLRDLLSVEPIEEDAPRPVRRASAQAEVKE